MLKVMSILAVICGILTVGVANANPIMWEANGHWYEYCPELVTWEQAHIVAENRTWNGEPGYLVTLTSQAENDFVYWEVLGGDAPAPEGDPWIGGYQNSSHSDPLENWHWVTTEPWEFTNWAPGEPNDYDELWGEMYLQFTPNGGGMWNDHHSLNPKPMIIEYSGDVVATEPTSWDRVKTMYRR